VVGALPDALADKGRVNPIHAHYVVVRVIDLELVFYNRRDFSGPNWGSEAVAIDDGA